MTERVVPKYRAFISYSHNDTEWAKWLHKALEGYRIDADLVGRVTSVGPVPKSLHPVFRDREDFSVGPGLTEQTVEVLEGSEFLILLCSPSAAKSVNVNEEVRRYKAMGRSRRIIPLIVDGEPNDPNRDCFPPALKFRVGADGRLTDEAEETLAADAREDRDGDDLALAKVVAALLGLKTDEVVRRQIQARRRQLRKTAFAATVFLFTAIAAVVGFGLAWREAKRNERLADKMADGAVSIVKTAVEQADRVGAPRKFTLLWLQTAERLLTVEDIDTTSPKARSRHAAMTIQFAHSYSVLADTKEQVKRAIAARDTLKELAAQDPKKPEYRRDLALALRELGDGQVNQGDTEGALASYREAESLLQSLSAADPTNADLKRQLAGVEIKIGDVQHKRGKMNLALPAYQSALGLLGPLVVAKPDDVGLRYEYSVSKLDVGDVLLAMGDVGGALTLYREAEKFRQDLYEADKENLDYLHQLTVVEVKIADALSETGVTADLAKAVAVYQQAEEHLSNLVLHDPNHGDWQHDLSLATVKRGDVLAGQNRSAEALGVYETAVKGFERLTKMNETNTDWQHNLSVAQSKVGDVLLDLKRPTDALDAYSAAALTLESLAKADPTNANWKRSVAGAYIKVGDALFELKRFDDALTTYRGARGLLKQRTESGQAGEENGQLADWLHIDAFAGIKSGDTLTKLEQAEPAIDEYRSALASLDRLVVLQPSNGDLKREQKLCLNRLSNLSAKLGRTAAAIEFAQRELETLNKISPVKLGEPPSAAQKQILDRIERLKQTPPAGK